MSNWTNCRLTRVLARGTIYENETSVEAPTEHEPESTAIERAAKEYVERALADAIDDEEAEEGEYYVYLRDEQGVDWRALVMVAKLVQVWSSGSAVRLSPLIVVGPPSAAPAPPGGYKPEVCPCCSSDGTPEDDADADCFCPDWCPEQHEGGKVHR